MKRTNWHKVFIIMVFLLILFLSATAGGKGASSMQLHKRITQDGNVTRIDYVNDEGKITYAADKYYATLIETIVDPGIGAGPEVISEIAAKTGKAEIATETEKQTKPEGAEETGNRINTTEEEAEQRARYNCTVLSEYFDEDGRPQKQPGGYYAMLRYYNADGRAEYEFYLNAASGDSTERTQMATEDGIYGQYYEYNEAGQNVLLAFLDENGNRAPRKDGCMIVRRKYLKRGNTDGGSIQEDIYGGLTQGNISSGLIQEDYYFDKNDEPMSLPSGAFATQIEKDEKGLNIRSTALGKDGKPVMTTYGYATSRRTHFPDGTIETETYYDAEDRPVALAQGQYGVRADGQKLIYIDENGEDMFVLSNFLGNHFESVMLAAIAILCVSVLMPRKISVFFLVLYLGFILYMTMLYRTGGEGIVKAEVFWSYRLFFRDPEMRMEILNNIMLFVPLGALLYKVHPRKKMLLAAVLLSAAIELAQYFLGIGYCEFDDVISNGLGAVLGFRTCHVFSFTRPIQAGWQLLTGRRCLHNFQQ